jgi:hypothetical protein
MLRSKCVCAGLGRVRYAKVKVCAGLGRVRYAKVKVCLCR